MSEKINHENTKKNIHHRDTEDAEKVLFVLPLRKATNEKTAPGD